MAKPFDFAAARADGYTDEEIVEHLKTRPGVRFDFESAVADGHSAKDIAGFLEQNPDRFSDPEKGIGERLKEFGSGIARAARDDLGFGPGALDAEVKPEDTSAKASPVAPMRADYYERLRRASIADPAAARSRATVDDTTGTALRDIESRRAERAGVQPPQDGVRQDGTPKGDGYLGRLRRPDGGISTELSVGVEIDGKETLIPALVPTLTEEEVQTLLTIKEGDGRKIPESIIEKAAAHARERISQGKSPFADGQPESIRPSPQPHKSLSSIIDDQQVVPQKGEEPYSLAKELRHQKANLTIGLNNLIKGVYHGMRMNEAAEAIAAYERALKEGETLSPEEQRTYEEFKKIQSGAMQGAAKIDEENAALFEKTSPAIQKLFSLQGKDWSAKTLGEIGEVVISNPRVIPDIAAQSGPASLAMIATALLARASGGTLGTAALAGGGASALVEFGNSYAQKRMEGKDHPDAYKESVARAGLVGIFDAASLASAGRALGVTMMKSGMGRKGWEVAKELGKQAGYGMGGEVAGSLAAGDTPDPVEVAAEGLGELATGPIEIATMGDRGGAQPATRGGEEPPVPADTVLGREEADFDTRTDHVVEPPATDPDAPLEFSREDVDLGRAEGAYDSARAAAEAATARAVDAEGVIPYEPGVAPAAPETAPAPLPPRESAAAAFEAAEATAAAQRDREVEALAAQARALRAEEDLTRARAAGHGIVEEDTSPAPLAAAMESTRIFGRPVPEASDATLKLVAEKGRGEAQAAARAELAKRAFERDLREAGGDRGAAETLAAVRGAQPSQRLASRPAFERLAASYPDLELEHLEGDAVPKAYSRAANLIAGSFGKQVVFVKADPSKFEGSVFTDNPDTIYLNVNARRPMRRLIGHETLHSLKRSNPKVYTELLGAISKTARGRQAAERYVARYGDQPTGIQIEEMVADMRGDFMDDPKFWVEVFRASKQPLVKKIAQAIRMIFDTLRMKLRIGERRSGGYRSAELIADIEAARKAFAKAYAEWEANPTAPAPQAREEVALASKPMSAEEAYWKWHNSEPLADVAVDAENVPKGEHYWERMLAAGKQAVADRKEEASLRGGTLASRPKKVGPQPPPDTPKYVGSNMPWKVTGDGRFTVYKYDSTVRGSSAVKGSKYTVYDSESKKMKSFDDLRFVDAFIHHARTGEQVKPWFGSATAEAPKQELLEHPEAKEYHHPAPRWDRPNEKLESRPSGGSLPGDEIRKAVAETEAGMRGKVAVWKAQGRYKWDRGQVLLSKSTGKLWTITSQFIGSRKNEKGAREDVPMYVAQHGDPKGDGDWIKSTLYADKAHESMVPVGRETLESRPDLRDLLSKLPKDEKGRFKGAPDKSPRDVWNLVQRMEGLARAGEQHKGWYADSAKEMLRAFDGNKTAAKIFAQVIAITSANTEVKANFTQADKALFQYAQGKAISVGTQSVDDKLNELLYFGIPWEGRKTNVFYTNLVEAIDGKKPSETTQDMHMGMIGFGKKQLTDAEYTFMDLVTKHVAARVGMTPQEAQAAAWVSQKARSLLERYEEKGFHSDKSPQAKRRMAITDAGINYGDLIRGRGWFWPDDRGTKFEKPRETRARGMQVTAEVKPSTKLAIGQALANMSMAKLQAYQRDALARVFGVKGPAALMEAMGLDRSKYRIIEGAGGYDASMAPNEIITLNVDRETATRVAKAWMYIFRQDAVPFFRTDKNLRHENVARAVQIRFAENLSNPLLRKVYDSLREQVHPGIGLTKFGRNVIAVVNYRGEDNQPFLMPDEEFLTALGAAVKRNALGAKINGYGVFGAETGYPYHEWGDRSGAGGETLAADAAGGRPDLRARLDRWADLFGRFAEKRGGKPQALESRPEVDSGALLDARAHQAATSPQNDKPEPTEAQKASGNYAKGHVRVAGLDVTIENPEGSERTWKRADGSTGSTTMKAHYGYIRGTEGADGDHLDIFIKPGTPLDYEGPVHVADQTRSGTGRFDEHKALLGWKDAKEARDAYKENYSKGWDGLEGVRTFESVPVFKEWLETGALDKRAAEQARVLESRPEDDDLDFTRDAGAAEGARMSAQDKEQIRAAAEEVAQRVADRHGLTAAGTPQESEGRFVPVEKVDEYLERRYQGETKTDRGRAGERFNLRIEWATSPRDGAWISATADGRYMIDKYDGGFLVSVDNDPLAWTKTRAKAIAAANRILREEVEKGLIANPAISKSPLMQYKPEQWQRAAAGWKKLSENKLLFRYKDSERKLMYHIAEDMGMLERISNIEVDEFKDSGYGVPSDNVSFVEYHIVFQDGTGAHINHNVKAKTAHIQANELVKGSKNGAILYQMALVWAHNNGVKLVPDPQGLTLINTYRRTEQMLSAALRKGTTRHMRPHKDQGLVGWNDNPTNADEEARNIALMALTSMRSVHDGVGRATKIAYDFKKRRFVWVDTSNKTPISREHLDSMVKDDKARARGIGRTTLARAIFTNSLLEDAEGAKQFIDGKISPSMILGGPEVEESLQLYSRPEQETAKNGPIKRGLLALAKGTAVAVKPFVTAADIANATMDAVAKIPGVPVAKVSGWAYDRFMTWQSNFWRAGEIRQSIAHAVTADYGLPEPYLDRRDDRDIEIQKNLRKSKQVIDRIGALNDAESRVAYLWMQEKPNTQEEQRLLGMLPADSRQALADMKEQIRVLGREAAALGLISEETLQRNEMAYLHRSYQKYEVQNPQAVAASSRAKQIRADNFKGRGLRDDVSAERLPGAQKGDHFVRLELRKPTNDGTLGPLKRVVYLRAGIPVPSTYSGWRNDGVWEARFMDRPGAVGLWRDFTVEERERMGEIREVRYAFARTMVGLVHDIETARFLKWTMENYSVADEDAVVEKGGTVADAIDNAFTLKSYSDNDWVQVPGTVAQGTRLYKYGALQSRYVPGHIWNDIRATINMRSSSAVWRLYDELLTAWKISKTALSPTVHTNNVMANLVFMDIQDIKNRHLVRALQTLIDAERGREDARSLLERYLDSGAELGTPALHELRREVIEPLLGKLQGEENDTLAQISTIQAIGLAARGNVRQAWAALSSKGAARMAAKPFQTMLAAYQLEDSVFRMASWMKSIEEGKTDRDAGALARKHFLDYRINAPWIQALRRGPFPFLAFTYRAVPLMAEAYAKKPWKIMKYAASAYLLNSLAYAMLGLGEDDEERERALLPDERRGNTILGVPRLLRMPWNDKHGSPVFLDIRRWVPGGDLFDIHGSHSAIPTPSWLALGGFWGLGMELMSNKNAFTGKEIWTETDPIGDRVLKTMDHLFRFMSPNVPFPNPVGYLADALAVEKGMLQTYSWRNVQAAGSGITDDFGRERSLPQALASSVGVKLASYPPDQLRRNLAAKRDYELRDLNEATARYRREWRRSSRTEADRKLFTDRMRKQAEKKREIQQRYGERLRPVSR